MKAEKFIFENSSINVEVIGCGGTGSLMLSNLARLNVALAGLGRPQLNVTAWDPDIVTDANLGRQLFYACDLGRNKAEVLIERINFNFGFDWKFLDKKYGEKNNQNRDNKIVVGCVDSRKARKMIISRLDHCFNSGYYIDCGNGADFGQVLVGQFGKSNNWSNVALPPWKLMPELFDDTIDDGDDVPSCSLAAALHKQHLFVNAEAALLAGKILEQLLRFGKLEVSGFFFNQASGQVRPIPLEVKRHYEVYR